MHPRVGQLLRYLRSHDWDEFGEGKVELDGGKIFFSIYDSETKDDDELHYEVHKDYIDIQFVLEGEELLYYGNLPADAEEIEADEEEDYYYFEKPETRLSHIHFCPGEFIILFPGELHAPGGMTDQGKCTVRKFIGKVLAE